MKLSIDAEECTGHGRCYNLAPELFADDERGFGQVLGEGIVSENIRPLAVRAAQSCPERAITIEDDPRF